MSQRSRRLGHTANLVLASTCLVQIFMCFKVESASPAKTRGGQRQQQSVNLAQQAVYGYMMQVICAFLQVVNARHHAAACYACWLAECRLKHFPSARVSVLAQLPYHTSLMSDYQTPNWQATGCKRSVQMCARACCHRFAPVVKHQSRLQ